MKKYLKLPLGINTEKKNIFSVNLPYYLLAQKEDQFSHDDKPWIVFWGVPFKNLPMVYADEAGFIEQSNVCLDYLRREYADCRLLYKPHPNETGEQAQLELAGFEILSQKEVSEFFVLKNFHKIKTVFSTYSSASMTAYKLGLDAHIFLPLIEPYLTQANREGNREYYKRLPQEFFISDLSAKPRPNRLFITPTVDPVLGGNLVKLIKNHHPTIAWFILGDPGSLTSVILLARLLKNLAPDLATGLIIEQHHRWKMMNLDEVAKFFDRALVYPRWLASLRPNKIWGQIKTAWSLRQAPIAASDILMCFNYTSFVENCLLSYFPTNQKIAFVKKETLEFCYGPKDKAFFQVYFSRIGHRFYQKVVQPLLGLRPTVFLEDPVRVANFDRYLLPVNDLYDQVYVY